MRKPAKANPSSTDLSQSADATEDYFGELKNPAVSAPTSSPAKAPSKSAHKHGETCRDRGQVVTPADKATKKAINLSGPSIAPNESIYDTLGTELGHGQIVPMAVASLRPAPENDTVYTPIDLDDPKFQKLVESVRTSGVQEPLIISSDGFIISGHRRFAAAKAAGLTTVPCIVRADISHAQSPTKFLRALTDCNRNNREKTFQEKLHEEAISTDPAASHQALIEHREKKSKIRVKTMDLGDVRNRAELTKAKQPMLIAVKRVIDELRSYLPASDRQIHYALLNDPPLIHASKPGSVYRNDLKSYKALVDLLTRARIAGELAYDDVADETRPVLLWDLHRDVQDYLAQQFEQLFMGYRRDLLQSQPNHIELVVEKNTVRSIIEPVAEKYTVPLTSGRGYCSLPPRHGMAERYFASGKEKLILLVLSDFDPDGQTIASSLARSLRDDFGVWKIEAVKVALTGQQVRRLHLPPGLKAKAGAATREKFVAEHGEHVFELEAVRPAELQRLTREAIESVLDFDAFNAELDREKADAAHLMAQRRTIMGVMGR